MFYVLWLIEFGKPLTSPLVAPSFEKWKIAPVFTVKSGEKWVGLRRSIEFAHADRASIFVVHRLPGQAETKAGEFTHPDIPGEGVVIGKRRAGTRHHAADDLFGGERAQRGPHDREVKRVQADHVVLPVLQQVGRAELSFDAAELAD